MALMAGLVVTDYSLGGRTKSNTGNFVTVSLVNESSPETSSVNPPVSPQVSQGLSSSVATGFENKISLPEALPAASVHSPQSSHYTPPVFLVRENPQYPTEALSEGRQGKVVVKVYISAQGKVESTQVIESSGSPSLDKAAEQAASSSQFTPAERDHQPISSEATATYRFELR